MAGTDWTPLLTAAGTFLGGFTMYIANRRSGKLSMSDQQIRYIEEQQNDIRALRNDFANLSADFNDLWDWAIAATGKAQRQEVDLGPMPRRRPRSESVATEGTKA